MPYTDDGKNLMLNALGNNITINPITHVALYDGDPTGAGVEINGGTPAYARKAIGFDPSASGVLSDDGTAVVFDVPALAAVDYVCFFNAITGGTLLAYKSITEITFTSQGTLTLTTADLDLNL